MAKCIQMVQCAHHAQIKTEPKKEGCHVMQGVAMKGLIYWCFGLFYTLQLLYSSRAYNSWIHLSSH